MDDDVTFEEVCAAYEEMDQAEYEQFMNEMDARDAEQQN